MTLPRRLLRAPDALALFDAARIRAMEAAAAARLPEHALMARAGAGLVRLARAIAPHARRAWIAAGPGNNGGDGLVLAAALQAAGLQVHVTLAGHDPARALPADAAWALDQARQAGVALSAALPGPGEREAAGLVVDAVLGLGQKRPPAGPLAEAVRALNAGGGTVLAVDVPTGLDADTGAALGPDVVRATHTLTLLAPKPGLFTGAGREFAGEIWFDPIGCEDELVASASELFLGGEAQAAARHPPRRHLAHKGSFGDVHVAGGAAGMVGAALLAGQAAAAAGAGRVLVHTRASDPGGVLAVDPAHPELMLRPLDELVPGLRADPAATVVAGCGGGDEVARVLPACLWLAARLVIDADGLNAIARDEALAVALRARAAQGRPTILTPHPLEAARLLGTSSAQVQADRLASARRLARQTGAVVVLKGSGTVVAAPGGRTSINPTGDARLATAGTGDVLAGWLAGLWAAQGRSPGDADDAGDAMAFDVAVAGTYVHGAACDHAAGPRGPLVAGALVRAMTQAAQALAG